MLKLRGFHLTILPHLRKTDLLAKLRHAICESISSKASITQLQSRIGIFGKVITILGIYSVTRKEDAKIGSTK